MGRSWAVLGLTLFAVAARAAAPVCPEPPDRASRLSRLGELRKRTGDAHFPAPWNALGLTSTDWADATSGEALEKSLAARQHLPPEAAHALVTAVLWSEPPPDRTFAPPATLASALACYQLAALRSPGSPVVLTALLSLDPELPIGAAVRAVLEGAPDEVGLGLRVAASDQIWGPWRLRLLEHLASRHPDRLEQIVQVVPEPSSGWVELFRAAHDRFNRDHRDDAPARRVAAMYLEAIPESLPLVAARDFQHLLPGAREDVLRARWQPPHPTVDLREKLAAACLFAEAPCAAELYRAITRWPQGSTTDGGGHGESGRHRGVDLLASGGSGASSVEPLRREILDARLGGKKPDDVFELYVALQSSGSSGPESLSFPWDWEAGPVVGPRLAESFVDSLTSQKWILQRALKDGRRNSPDGLDLRFVSKAKEQLNQERQQELVYLDKLLAAHRSRAASHSSLADRIITRALAERLPTVFTQRPRAECDAAIAGAKVPQGTLHAPAGFEIVGAANQGGVVRAVALSQRLDPTGEVSGGAYWLLERRKNGSWSPTYLGLRQYHPFDVPARAFPVVKHGRLYLLADVRQLDERSITFPPIGMATLREQKGVCIAAALSVLKRDSDGDGLTDLVEARLMTNPHARDSDGDGIPDGTDALPQVPAGKIASAKSSLVESLLIQLIWGKSRMPEIRVGLPRDHGLGPGAPVPAGFEGGDPVIYLCMDASQLEGVDLPFRVVPLGDEEVKKASSRFGAFFPMTIDLEMSPKGDQAFIVWDERWRGGTFRARLKAGRWDLQALSGWIT